MMQYPLNKDEMLNERTSTSSACLQEYPMDADEVLAAITSALVNDPRLRYRLVYYALKNIRLYFSSDNINGLTAQDVVQSVIEKLITGLRKWNKQHIPDIKSLMFAAIKSFIRNEIRRKKKTVLLSINKHTPEVNEASLKRYINDCNRRDYEDNIFCSDLEIIITKLKQNFKNDDYASIVLDEILEGAESNIEIAKNLNIPIKDVENAKKRIRNKANKLIKKSG